MTVVTGGPALTTVLASPVPTVQSIKYKEEHLVLHCNYLGMHIHLYLQAATYLQAVIINNRKREKPLFSVELQMLVLQVRPNRPFRRR